MKHDNLLPLNLVDGEHDEDERIDNIVDERDNDEDEDGDDDGDDEDDDIDGDQRTNKSNERLSPELDEQHAKVTAAAVAHINGTSEYISFKKFFSFNILTNYTVCMIKFLKKKRNQL